MKLTASLKKKIDKYFNEISAKELCRLLVNKYDAKIFDINSKKLDSVKKNKLKMKDYNEVYIRYDNDKNCIAFFDKDNNEIAVLSECSEDSIIEHNGFKVGDYILHKTIIIPLADIECLNDWNYQYKLLIPENYVSATECRKVDRDYVEPLHIKDNKVYTKDNKVIFEITNPDFGK